MTWLERFAGDWTPEPNTGCYIWTGPTNGRGYARKWLDRKALRVTRLVCEDANGPSPTAEHLALHNTPNGCVGAICVNGSHLRWGTTQENQLDIPEERRSERMRKIMASLTSEQRSERMRKGWENFSSEQRSVRVRRSWENLSSEQRIARMSKAREARWPKR